jgi:hypothetical protein
MSDTGYMDARANRIFPGARNFRCACLLVIVGASSPAPIVAPAAATFFRNQRRSARLSGVVVAFFICLPFPAKVMASGFLPMRRSAAGQIYSAGREFLVLRVLTGA